MGTPLTPQEQQYAAIVAAIGPCPRSIRSIMEWNKRRDAWLAGRDHERERWDGFVVFVCPHGHRFAVLDAGEPMDRSLVCPACGTTSLLGPVERES